MPAHRCALACARQTLPKRKARQQKDERPGEEDQRGRATPQRASRLPWDLSFRLVQGKAVPAPGAQVAVRSHLRWQSSSTKVECFSFPFSSSIHYSKRCKISNTVKVDCLQNSLSGPAAARSPAPAAVTPAAPAIAKLVQAPEVQQPLQPHTRPPRRSSGQTLTIEPRGHKGR